MAKIAIIVGSQRADAQSAKVARYIDAFLRGRGTETFLLVLGTSPLALWTDNPNESSGLATAWQPIGENLVASSGLIFVTPEWNGMVTPALQNFFLHCTNHELADRPALIVTVSSGMGGSTPAAELRMASYKDTHVCYIPEQVIVRDVVAVLNAADEPESEYDAHIRFRLTYAIDILLAYASGLAQVRASLVRDFDRVPYGM